MNRQNKNIEVFQGNLKLKSYFEGWYFKNVSEDDDYTISFIPGISLNKADSHAFIQVIIAPQLETHYFRFELDEFKSDEKELHVEIGNNHFSKKEIEVHLENDSIVLHGKLMFEDLRQIGPQAIMGPFGGLSFLECYHGLISMRHSIFGKIVHNGREINFNRGRGYIEKDWGKSFPKHYIWMQANHFMNEEASFMLSIADIPFKLFSFNGFLCSVLINQKEYRFATYTDAKIKIVDEIEGGLHIRIIDRKHILDVWANHSEASDLKAPKMGQMSGIIKEGLDSEIKIRLVFNEEIIYEGKSRFGSIERFEDEKFLHKWGAK